MTNIYILSKSYLDFVFCSLFIGRQKKQEDVVTMYTCQHTHTHTHTH